MLPDIPGLNGKRTTGKMIPFVKQIGSEQPGFGREYLAHKLARFYRSNQHKSVLSTENDGNKQFDKGTSWAKNNCTGPFAIFTDHVQKIEHLL